jgi:outer membrane biosynthesis protein TonB
MIKLAVSTALLVLLAGPSAYAPQEPEKEKEKPAQQEEKKQEPERKPEEKPQQEKPQQEKEQSDRAKQTEKQEQDAAKHQQQAAKQQQQQTEKERTQQAQHSVQPTQHENTANNHDAGRRIPEDNFRAHFGRQHAFRVARRDDRRFNYGGYWFTYNDTWPSAWSYDDDVYVDEIDGEYYLIDPVHPGLRLLVVVSD